jgi:hypothetical protein
MEQTQEAATGRSPIKAVHIYFSRSYRKLRTEMARQQYPDAGKSGKNFFLVLLKTDY